MEMDAQRRRPSDESDVQPTPPPLSLNPATPVTHPRLTAQDTDLFVSPAPHTKVYILLVYLLSYWIPSSMPSGHCIVMYQVKDSL